VLVGQRESQPAGRPRPGHRLDERARVSRGPVRSRDHDLPPVLVSRVFRPVAHPTGAAAYGSAHSSLGTLAYQPGRPGSWSYG